ncbi:MAG: redox-regulated ATPase YchF [Candidatus Aenigmarchaeota archaeon]|nr:redox-regulated ATPase YchF [Candidatus Aenigmarchaeota archaeon]
MQIGLVGKPSSGKSSFFKAATMIDVDIADYPFTTIKPNVGLGHVTKDCICKEFGVECNPNNSICEEGKRLIPVKLIDVAGLVPDAHLGKGMGNQFLDDLRQADCLIHIVDASGLTDAEGKVTKNHDPSEDIKFLEREIDLWFTEIIKRALEKYKRKRRVTKVDLLDILTDQLTGLGIVKGEIKEVMDKIDVKETQKFTSYLRKMSKPIIIAANKIDLPTSEENYKEMISNFPDLTIIPTSAAAEIALKTAEKKSLIKYQENKIEIIGDIEGKQKKGLEFIRENVLKRRDSTGIRKCLNTSVFDVLDYIAVYPVADANKLTDKKGNILPDTYLVKKGTKLKEFAFMIHSDIGEKFIGGLDARKKIKLGANYELKDNDVIEILTQN